MPFLRLFAAIPVLSSSFDFSHLSLPVEGTKTGSMSLVPDEKDRTRSPKRRGLRLVFWPIILVLGAVVAGALVVKNLSLGSDSGRSSHSSTGTKPTPPAAPRTVEDYVDLINYEYALLRPDQRPIATVLHEEVASLNVSGQPLMALNNVILSGLQKLQPGDDATPIRTAVQRCRSYANEIFQRYQNILNDVTAKLISVNLSPTIASAVAKAFAERIQTTEAVARAAALNDVCSRIGSLLDLLSNNPTKWKRDSDGNLLSVDRAFTDQFNTGTNALNTAIRKLNGAVP